MKNRSVLVAGLALGLATPFVNLEGQTTAVRSRAAGFYVGGGLDGSSIVVYGNDGVEEPVAGPDAHFTPAVALSAAIMATIGTFDTFKVGDRTLDGSAIGASTTRLHLGVVWFPTA